MYDHRAAERKENMNEAQIKNILTSTSNEDWIVSEEKETWTYKQDVLLRIQKRSVNLSEKFGNEHWAINYPDSNAYKVIYDVYYYNSWIATKTLVAVDGFRATLPMPKIRTTEIPFEEYRFAMIVAPTALDEYITRSGLTVESAT